MKGDGMECEICEKEDGEVNENNPLCDFCWYGMRMDPEGWKAELAKQGIEVERSMGCQPIPGVGIVCGNPWKRKGKS